MTIFNGFDKGVIGKPLPADTTLNNMRKADLIELLHLAENNHDVLAQAYRIAVDNSKCHQCPLGRDREKIRADAIDDFVAYANTMPTVEDADGYIRPMTLEEMAEEMKKGKTCSDCIIDKTDACPRGAGRAVDDEICEEFLKGEAENE